MKALCALYILQSFIANTSESAQIQKYYMPCTLYERSLYTLSEILLHATKLSFLLKFRDLHKISKKIILP